MAVDKKLIKERKAMYGSNFECISKAWSEMMSIGQHGHTDSLYFTPKDVCRYMAKMKQCRIDAINKKLSKFPTPDVALKLHKALKDSIDDWDNYLWIADNFEEYQKL